MNLKEYIKQLTREVLDEESSTGDIGVGAGPIMTPYAFSKGKGKNAATKTAEKQGFKVTKGETEMPGDSKIKDYVSLTGKKKKKVKIYKESNYDAKSTYGQESGFTKASPSSNPSLYLQKSEYTSESMDESLENIIKEELLNEVTYHKFKNEVKHRTKSESLYKAIREVKRKLNEVDRLIDYTSRLKQELNEDEAGVEYWKRSVDAVNKISEVSNKISNKIKDIYQ